MFPKKGMIVFSQVVLEYKDWIVEVVQLQFFGV